MGGGDSTLRGSSRVRDDVIQFFESELGQWNDTIRNLKETAKNPENKDWVPVYLCQQMEQTETKWTNVKALISQYGKSGLKEGTCNIKRHKDLQDDIDQHKTNIDTLHQKNQNMEAEMQKQRQKINELRKANDALKAKGGTDSTEPSAFTKERQGTPSNIHSSEIAEAIANSKNQATEMEEKTKKQKGERDHVEAENDRLKQQVKELIEERDKLNERNKKLEMDIKNAIDKTKDHNQGGYQRQNVTKTETERLQKQIRDMQTDFEKQKLKLLEEKHILKAQKETLETHANDLKKEKDVLLLRLSKIAGDKLVNNNAAIADLSDPNRPTKLGEFYSEIYDNEWTDAFDALKDAGYGEEEAIETLRMTLENVVQFCESKAALVIHKSTDAVNLLFEDYRKSVIAKEMPSHLTMPRKRALQYGKLVRPNSSLEDIKLQQRWKPKQTQHESGKDKPRPEKITTKENSNIDVDHKLRQLRKEMATYMIPIVQKAYIEACWTNECIEALKPFILKCIYLGWMMVVQSPPMVLHRCQDDQEIKFEKNFHREYTTTGPLVRYIVWPALLLNENGPVVCKGVAECKKPIKKDNA